MQDTKNLNRDKRRARINLNEAYAIFKDAPEGTPEKEEARILTLRFEKQYGRLRAHSTHQAER